MVEQESRPRPKGSESQAEQGGLFTGTAEAEERASQFTAATPIIEDPVHDAGELTPSKPR
jgi:hypothetical protein